jgi:hypothetical protein
MIDAQIKSRENGDFELRSAKLHLIPDLVQMVGKHQKRVETLFEKDCPDNRDDSKE